jgi:hypothetical protein
MALQVSHTAHDLHPVLKNAAVSGATAPKPPTNICALIARIIVAHIVKEAKRSPSQQSQHRSDSRSSFDSRDEAGIDPSDGSIRFLHFWGKHFEDYNGLGNGCLLIGLRQKYGKPTLRPSETMSVNTCALSVLIRSPVRDRGRYRAISIGNCLKVRGTGGYQNRDLEPQVTMVGA